jgi:hypothetical protein
VGVTLIPVDETCGTTVTLHDAVVPLATDFATMSVVPSRLGVTTPPDTVATDVSVLDHETLPLGADAVSLSRPGLSTLTLAASCEIVTGSFTVSVQYAVLPVDVLARIFTVPALTPLI